MNRKWTMAVVAMAVLALGVIAYVNHVALRAMGLKAAAESQRIAESQVIDNWEIFFRRAVADLGREINAQDAKLQDLRVRLVTDRTHLAREKDLLPKYESALKEFSDKARQAGTGAVDAYGRTYTADAAQAQMREFAGAVVDEQAKIKTLEEGVKVMETQTQDIENALRVARDQMDKLQKKGEQMVREKSLADLKAMAIEISGAVGGLDPRAPLTGAMQHVNELLGKMQARIDASSAAAEVNVRMASGETRIVTVQQALQQLDYSEREKRIDAVVKGAAGK